MVHRSFDQELLIEATECHRDLWPVDNFVQWFEMPNNIMLAEGRDVGLVTYEFPGCYTVHWYYQDARGRDAIDLGKKMVGFVFENYDAKVLRGLIRTDFKASRWACRQVGFKSYGNLTFADGDENELFFITRDEYLNMKEKDNG
jgi:hypothetical protein